MSISEVDFGRLEAEKEEHLQEYFVDTGVLGRLMSGTKQFIIGRKGSEKTALFRYLRNKSERVLSIEFDDYSWDAHKTLRETGVLAESAYISSWRFTLPMGALSLRNQ